MAASSCCCCSSSVMMVDVVQRSAASTPAAGKAGLLPLLARGGRRCVVHCQANRGNDTLGNVAEDIRKKTESAAASLKTPSSNANGAGASVREAVDRSTKVDVDVERHQAETTSEEQSWLGSKPASTVPWPRPEIERRPETGDRSLGSLFAVDGAAPETINGRMAMVGFVWAAVAEKMTGLTVAEQLFNPGTSGLLYFAGVVQLFTLASLVPLVKGESTDARRWGPFNAQAERWNGRLAMIGFAALVIDEFFRQAPVFGGHM